MKSPFSIPGFIVLVLAAILSFGIDWKNVAASGSVDLRNRITGIRLLQEGRDPFHYKWRTNEPEQFCDPYNNLAVPVSKTTVTPAFLILHCPLAPLPYRPVQFLWLMAQWVALLGVGFLWWRQFPSRLHRLVFAAFLAGFTYSAAWRLHAERGQCYIILAFLLACWLVLSREPGKSGRTLWAGGLAGCLIALRPPLILVLAPFILWRRREQLPGLGVGLALGIVLPLFLDPTCWSDYGSAMQTWSDLYLSGANPRPPRQAFPVTVEGIPIDLLGRFADIPFADSSLFYGLRRLGITSVPAYPILGVFLALLGVWGWRARGERDEEWLLGIAAWSFVLDFFLPALRNIYNDVLILNAIALALVVMRRPWPLTWLPLLALPVSWCILAASPRAPWIINLPTLLFLAAAIAFLLRPWLARRLAI